MLAHLDGREPYAELGSLAGRVQMVDCMYEHGKAVNIATFFEIDDVIDRADSRRWITAALDAAPLPPSRLGKKRPNIDTW